MKRSKPNARRPTPQPPPTTDTRSTLRMPLTVPEVVADIRSADAAFDPPADMSDVVAAAEQDADAALEAARRMYERSARALLVATGLAVVAAVRSGRGHKDITSLARQMARVGALFGERGDDEDVIRDVFTPEEFDMLRVMLVAPAGNMARQAVDDFRAATA